MTSGAWRAGWLVRLAVLAVLVAGCERSSEPSPTRRGGRRRPRPPRRRRRVQEYPVPAGSRPHDVAPAADGRSVWYTAQGPVTSACWIRHRGEPADPARGRVGSPRRDRRPRRGPWVTDGGLNAIVQVDPAPRRWTLPLPPPGRRPTSTRPPSAVVSVVHRAGGGAGTARPEGRAGRGVRRPPGAGPLRHHHHPDEASSTPPWPAATSVASTTGRARPRCWSRPPATRAPGGSGRIPAAGSG